MLLTTEVLLSCKLSIDSLNAAWRPSPAIYLAKQTILKNLFVCLNVLLHLRGSREFSVEEHFMAL
jgi:hypothetical protein